LLVGVLVDIYEKVSHFLQAFFLIFIVNGIVPIKQVSG